MRLLAYSLGVSTTGPGVCAPQPVGVLPPTQGLYLGWGLRPQSRAPSLSPCPVRYSAHGCLPCCGPYALK